VAYTAVRSSDPRCLSLGQTAPKIAYFPCDLDFHLRLGSLGSPRHSPKRHLDRFKPFCRAHERGQQRDRHTDRSRYSVYSNRPHLTIAAMRPNTKLSRVCTDVTTKTSINHVRPRSTAFSDVKTSDKFRPAGTRRSS